MKFVYFKHVKDAIKKRKKAFILCGMAMLLVLTGVLNYTLTKKSKQNQEAASTTTTTTVNFFETYKTDRDSARASQLSLLNEIISSEYSTASEKATATESKTNLAAKMEKELILEGLIKAKGFDDAVVTIGSSYYNVIVKDDGNLGDEQIAQILSVIQSETGAKATNVKIIPVE